MSSPSRRWPTTATVLSFSTNRRDYSEWVCCRTIKQIGLKWLLSKESVRGKFSKVSHQPPQTNACKLPHARGCHGRRALTSRNAQHSTRAPLVRWCGILILQRSVLPGVKRQRYRYRGRTYLVHIKPSCGIIQQIRLCRKNVRDFYSA